MSDKDAAVKLPTLRWDLNVYNLLMIIAVASAFYATTNLRLNTAEDNAKKYIPIVDELVRKDANQDVRIANIIESQQDLRRLVNEQVVSQARTNSEVLSQLSAIRETLAWFRATLENSGAPRQLQQMAP